MVTAVYTDSEDIDVTFGAELLRSHGLDVVMLETQDPRQIADAAADAEILLVGYAPIDGNLLAKLPRLRIISLLSMGTDNVDVDACTRHNVWVTHLPNLSAEEVATHVLSMTLALVRNVSFYQTSVRMGHWAERPNVLPPRLSETRLGIIGLGNIGRQLGKISRPIFGQILGYDPLLPTAADGELARQGITRVNLGELTHSADIISLHVPLLESTREMVDAEFLSHMKRGSYLLNASRGGLVNTVDICDALADGQLAGIGLDVFEQEPIPPDNPLLAAEGNILLTPHVGYLSTRTINDYVRVQAEAVLQWAETGKPPYPVNAL